MRTKCTLDIYLKKWIFNLGKFRKVCCGHCWNKSGIFVNDRLDTDFHPLQNCVVQLAFEGAMM